MKVFISWSGTRSKAVAIAMTKWLPDIFQDLLPWMSDHDISAGARWNADLDAVLASANFGILCLTPENLSAPWVLFEAGALAKTVKDARVAPYLFHLTPANVQPPLSQFHGVGADEAGTFKLLQSINEARESNLSPERLKRAFDKFWPDLKDELADVPPTTDQVFPQRPDRELLEEILQLVRYLQAVQGTQEDEIGNMNTESLLKYFGKERERQKDLRIQGDEEGPQARIKLVGLELQRRFPNIFRPDDSTIPEEQK